MRCFTRQSAPNQVRGDPQAPPVTPAKAGVQDDGDACWIPAFAGMTPFLRRYPWTKPLPSRSRGSGGRPR